MLVAPDGQPSGYIEYLPGEFAWRGVEAAGFMLIHCVWVFSKRISERAWGSILVEGCLEDARKAGHARRRRDGPGAGLAGRSAVVPGKRIRSRRYRRRRTTSCLFVSSSVAAQTRPSRKAGIGNSKQYGQGHDHHPVKPVSAHREIRGLKSPRRAENEYGVRPTVVDLESWSDAQNAPTPYAIFALIYNGRLLADHQISRTASATS